MSAADHFVQRQQQQAAIAAQQAVDGEITSDIELYDSDRLALNQVIHDLQSSMGKQRDTRGWAEEVVERFGLAGYYVDVRLVDLGDGTIGTAITITDRVEEGEEFDHERMGHEVRSNILGKNPMGNVQKTMIGQTGFSATQSGLVVPGSN